MFRHTTKIAMNSQHVTRQSLATSVPILLALALLMAVVAPALAHGNRAAPGQNAPAALSQGPTDPVEMEAFLDDLFAQDMAANHIAGAAVSVVKDGKLLLAKGYGYADVEKGIPVDPEQTLFRIGSVGKLFTWTAVMQLAEQGKLDLDADINTYLDFSIPATYPQPITLKHLLTHTSGFEDVLLEGVVSDANDLAPVREWLVSHLAARVCAPEECVGYSNFNAMLAGYIVARVSGQPYDQYIQEQIFNPLGMAHSTVHSPIPADLRAQASTGYSYVDGAFQPFPDYAVQPAFAPSGAHYASVADMARFMIAHLQGGLYSDDAIAGARILQETTARQMQSTLYTPDPRLRGNAYGFADMSDNGQRTLGHSGYAPPMSSLLLLMPDQNLGVFVIYNSRDTKLLATQHLGFQRAFFDHYYPAPAVAPLPLPADFAQRAERFVGSYRECNIPTTLIKVGGLFGAFTISNPGDGALSLDIAGLKLRFVEEEPLYFHQVDGPFAMVFREDAQGRITHMYTDIMPQYTTVKLNWYETPGFNIPLLMGSVLIFLSVIPVAAIRAIRNRRSSDRKSTPPGAHAGYWLILVISVLNLLLVAATFMWVMQPSELHSPMLGLKIALGLGVVAAALTAGALIYAVLAWKNGYWSVPSRVYFSLVTVTAVAFVWFTNYWNLLGWRF